MGNEIYDDKSIEDLIDEVWEFKEKFGTWQAVGDQYGVSRTVVWRIANDGYEPRNRDARFKLGLDEILLVRASRDPQGRFQKRHY